jgi:hypothetical protein
MKSRLVNVRHTDQYDVLIRRPGKWGNPFHIGGRVTREKAIAMYEVYIRRNKKLLANLPELVGKVLGCCCAPERCHGEVLLRLLKERGLE